MVILDRPLRRSNQRVVEVVQLRCVDEGLAGLPFERRNTAFAHGLRPLRKACKKFIHIQLGHTCSSLRFWEANGSSLP